MTEGTYDKEYVATHVVGFDKFEDYVLGREDGVPKTPEWAAAKCGVPEWTIKALAREWASQPTRSCTSTAARMSAAPTPRARAAGGVPPRHAGPGQARGPSVLQDGRGRPLDERRAPTGKTLRHAHDRGRREGAGKGSMDGVLPWPAWPSKQVIPKTQLDQAILEEPVLEFGQHAAVHAHLEDQFKKYAYPIPKEEGGTEIHMIWMDNPCRTTCWNDGFKTVEAFRSPKIEASWCSTSGWRTTRSSRTSSCLSTPSSKKRTSAMSAGGRSVQRFMENQAIEPIGESSATTKPSARWPRSWPVRGVHLRARRSRRWIKSAYEHGVEELISWEDFSEKQYYIVPTDPDWEKVPAGLREFYEDPEEQPAGDAERQARVLLPALWPTTSPDDNERAPLPKWVENRRVPRRAALRRAGQEVSAAPDDATTGAGALHAQNDDITWQREITTCKIKGCGRLPVRAHLDQPRDAETRGIKDGDIVKLFNERGTVLGAPTSRNASCLGRLYGPRRPGRPHQRGTDRPGRREQPHLPHRQHLQELLGQATSGFLVDVEKLTMAEMEEWREKYPEFFAREYDPAAGLRFDAWLP